MAEAAPAEATATPIKDTVLLLLRMEEEGGRRPQSSGASGGWSRPNKG